MNEFTASDREHMARALALDSAHRRLVQFLQVNTRAPSAGAFPELRHFTHGEIASRIGTSRETVSRLLKELQKAGSLRVTRYTLTVLKPLPAMLARA